MTVAWSYQELYAQVQALTRQLEEVTQRLDQGAPVAEQDEPKLLFPDVESWVQGLFLPMFGWRVDGQRWYWCPQWWRHAEAIWRLELLWRSWEAARLQPTGMSGWSAEFDRHKVELLGDERSVPTVYVPKMGIVLRGMSYSSPLLLSQLHPTGGLRRGLINPNGYARGLAAAAPPGRTGPGCARTRPRSASFTSGRLR